MKLKHMRFLSFFFFVVVVIFFNGASGTNITVVNDCGFTVWPGISNYYLNTTGLSERVLNTTGFELTKGSSRLLQAPENWSGSIWGRTGCNFNGSSPVSCTTGDCGNGEMECDGRIFTSPVTVAEISSGNTYYVSIINGYNLPLTIETTGRNYPCPMMGCAENLNQRCPEKLKLEGGGGCKSACEVLPSQYHCCKIYLDGTCKPTSYGQLFHLACPKSVTYEYDERDNRGFCEDRDYIVKFCPPNDTLSTIKLGSRLSNSDRLVSIGGNFTLGFFGASYSYLGIWYTNDVESRKVWVANRNKPIYSTSGNHTLSINPDTGNLIIIDGHTTLMSITDFEAGSNPNVSATLKENGNFQLINNNDKRVLWQSFDHPTDVLLPGMKLGYDITTGKNWNLTSWLSNEIPNEGAYTLSWEPVDEASQKLIIRRRGQPYWTSGNLKNNYFQFYSLYNDKLTSVYNKNERYFAYDDDDGTSLSMWLLTPEGKIVNSYNSVESAHEFCYGYETVDGCLEEPSIVSDCRREHDKFSYRNGEFASVMTYNYTDDNSSISISDCFVKCWNDCDCVGFNSSNTNGTGCIFWSGSNSFSDNLREISSPTWIYVINPQNPSSGYKTKNKTTLILILIGIVITLLCLRLGLFWCLQKKNRRQEEKERRERDEYFIQLTTSDNFKDVHHLESDNGKGSDLLIFSFASIMAATNDFSIENKLGQGGFGPVYKGQISDGQEIAIKRLSRTSDQGLVEFKNELVLITKLQHTNLVRVLGCCIHGEEKMLIYEYMHNKSLDFFLFDENRKLEVDWLTRLKIIEGIAQGLLYLHKYSRMCVIHRDLKANNILLDEHMNPKISDFGMARMFKQNETEAMTTNRVVGTFGYMSPEYIMEGTFSIKSDIFSFGVLILEIISGRKNSCIVHLDRTFNLIGYAWELWQKGETLELKDPALGNTCIVQEFIRIVHIALLCVQESATDRPTTSEMISMLLNDTVLLPAPKKPAFFTGIVELKSTTNEIKPKHCSVNNMTITDMDGR